LKSDIKKINHISFIMDGNGRWAKERNLPRNAGHKAGVEKAKEIILTVKELGIPIVSLYTFSKENWIRPKSEISFLMKLIVNHFEKEFEFYIKNKIRIIHIGDRSGVDKKVLSAIDSVARETKKFDSCTALLAFNYSGKYDIIQAVKKIIKEKPAQMNEESFAKHLLTAEYPEPDLIVRTSGEFRISNYFFWQAAYSEFFITKKYWPDFKKEDLRKIVDDYYNRERRFGGVVK
jgi:undecaprenyl diphosphate synthase